MIIRSGFEVYLMRGVAENCYYVMINCSKENLEEFCDQLNLEVKLLDSYTSIPYQVKLKKQFEPFRSINRQ
jgi:hypothetical protein